MSRKPWKRDRTTGLSLRRIHRLDDEFHTTEGHFEVDKFPDCDLFSRDQIAAVAGYANPSTFWQAARDDPLFHYYEIRDRDDHLITIATYSDSGRWYGQHLRAEKARISQMNLKRGNRMWPIVEQE